MDIQHSNSLVEAQFRKANQLRSSGLFQPALKIYVELGRTLGFPASILHNSAVCLLGLGRKENALKLCVQAQRKEPQFAQSYLLQSRIEKILEPTGVDADLSLSRLLAIPQLNDSLAGQARVELAALQLNTFCDPDACAQTILPILNTPQFAERARLSYLVSKFYSRTETDEEITKLAFDYANEFLKKPKFTLAKHQPTRRRQIGLLSNMIHGGPLYYLTISAFTQLSESCDIILFNRSKKSDWATEKFRTIAAHEISCRGMNWVTLSETIRDQKLDVLYECGGWSDTEALKAVSTKPAPRQYKWVGGQAMTTGLDCFDGFISDPWHTPEGAQPLYTEPLLLMANGYAIYTPPDYMPRPRTKDRGVVGIIGNPLKVCEELFSRLGKRSANNFQQPKEIRLIDKRYSNPKVRERIEPLMKRFKGKVTWVVTENHQHFLEELSRLEGIFDTSPHSAGLTAREALHLGVKVIPPAKERLLFSSRHGISALAAYSGLANQTPPSLPI